VYAYLSRYVFNLFHRSGGMDGISNSRNGRRTRQKEEAESNKIETNEAGDGNDDTFPSRLVVSPVLPDMKRLLTYTAYTNRPTTSSPHLTSPHFTSSHLT
jgi:hypothetical protein